MDVVKARLEVEASLKRHLVDRYEDHAYLTRVRISVPSVRLQS